MTILYIRFMKAIYSLTNKVNNKKYVGSSVNVKNRWRQHRHQLNKQIHGNSHLQSSWNKYGAEAFEFSVLEECNNLEEREQYWIEYYNCINAGYNQRLNCSTNRGIKRSEEFKEACRERWLGHVQSEEQIAKRIETMRLKKESGEYQHGGWKLTEEQLKKRKEKGRTKVYQYTLNNELVAEHHAINAACINSEFNSSGISNCARGHRKSYKGFKWSYTPLTE